MSEPVFSLVNFLGDAKSIAICFGLAVSTLVAIFSVSKETKAQTRRLLYTLACAGFLIGGYSTWLQSKGEHKAESDLEKIKNTVDQSGMDIDTLALLNKVSPSTRFHIRLLTDPTIEAACYDLGKIVGSLPDAVKTGNVRIVKVAVKNPGDEPYILIFGSGLTLTSAEAFYRLAIAHGLAGGNPLIRRDTPESLQLPEVCPPAK